MPNKNTLSGDIERYGGRSQTISNNAAGLSEVIREAAENIEKRNAVARADLADMDEVYKRTVAYLRHCEACSSLPDVAGLAAWMGFSRRGLSAYAYRPRLEKPIHAARPATSGSDEQASQCRRYATVRL